MIYKERLFKILRSPYVSEKASVILQECNVVVFKVARYATKSDIKNAIIMLFSVKINNVNTVIISGKSKGSVNNIGHRNNWKKAYITLKKGQKIDFIDQQK